MTSKGKRTAVTPSTADAVATAPVAPARKRILLVDDHPLMRAGLAQLINRQSDLVVCGEAGDPAEAFRKLVESTPDLVLADISMPGRSGIDFIKDLQSLLPAIAILVVSAHDEMHYAERSLRAGARGYIMKDASGEGLLAAIRQVLGGGTYVSPRLGASLADRLAGPRPRGSSSPFATLSDREFEVFQLLGRGNTTREIAKQLHLSPKTVDTHRANLKEKLRLKNATALLRAAVRWVETQDLGG